MIDFTKPLKITKDNITEDIDIIDFKCKKIMTFQGNVFDINDSIIIHN